MCIMCAHLLPLYFMTENNIYLLKDFCGLHTYTHFDTSHMLHTVSAQRCQYTEISHITGLFVEGELSRVALLMFEIFPKDLHAKILVRV